MLNRNKSEWDEDDWWEYTKRFVHTIGGDVENKYLMYFVKNELKDLYSEAFKDGLNEPY